VCLTDTGLCLHLQQMFRIDAVDMTLILCLFACFATVRYSLRGPGSSVGIATDYGLDGPGISGFGGLGVCMLASGTQDRGFAHDRNRRIFPAGEIHSMQYDTIQTTIASPIPEQ
jgi:hypothetical protein